MTAANISFVRSLYAAFGRGDISAIVDAIAPNAAWEVVGREKDYPLFGARKGPAAVRDFFKQVGENQERVSFTPRDFHAVGDMVLVLGHYTWMLRKTGRPVDTEWAHVFTVRSGKVAAFREFTDTAQFAQNWRG
ncbi:MAG TPA: nuclear transport factor 2 family protein [Pseudolabrys sp.]|nr:nuclear transport factor 2 family protein [Pseudolabrys sp.]